MEYTFERKQVGKRNLWIREWRGGNYADVVRYDFISYDTCIGIYFPGDKILYVGECACYSPTTRQHAGIMIDRVNDLAGSVSDYFDVKSVALNDYEILYESIYDDSCLRLLPGKQAETRLQCCFKLNKDYCNEIWGCMLCPM